MKIVLLEDLAISKECLENHLAPLRQADHEIQIFSKTADAQKQAEECRDADIIVLANMPLAKEALEQADHLKYIDVAFTGYDHIPMDTARDKGILVSNASGYATDAVAELCLANMIALLRDLDKAQTRTRSAGTKAGLNARLLKGKTVGIIGAGSIGKQVARLAKAFGAQVIAYNRSPVQDPAIDQQVSLPELLKSSDLVSLHIPLTEQTRHLISHDQLAMMKPSAFLINTARGPVVDEEALADALEQGVIAGAALDVFDKEPPLNPDSRILKAPNCLVTPHLGFFTEESMEDRAQIVFDNLENFLAGHPTNIVN